MVSERFVPLNDLRRSWIATSEQAHSRVTSVLQSGWFILGPQLEAFESELGNFLGTGQPGVGVASGTDALQIAMTAVGCGPTKAVLTAPNAGGYASIAAARAGVPVVYADVDPETLLLTADTVAAALSDDIGAVVVTHLYGNIADVPEISRVCSLQGVLVIEDCAQAIGGAWDGMRVGSLANVACFSFYPTKNLGGAGDGGAVISDSASVVDRSRALRQYGWEERYHVQHEGGINSRLDEIQAALLRESLPMIDSLNAARRAIVAEYARALEGGRLRILTRDGAGDVAHLAVIQVPTSTVRDLVRAELAELGVATEIHYPVCDHFQSGLPAPIRTTKLNNAEFGSSTVLTVPCFPEMTNDEISHVADALSCVGRMKW